MRRKSSSLVVFLVAAAWTAPCSADKDWTLSKLNPFQNRPAAGNRVQASLSDEASGDKTAPRTDKPSDEGLGHSTMDRSQPSLLTKVNRGTKAFFYNTWDNTKGALGQTKDALSKTTTILMPWTKTSKEGDSWLVPSWWRDQQEPRRPRSVKEFLALPRPEY